MDVSLEHWPRATPVRITGYTFNVIDVVVVSLRQGDVVGRGEAAGVFYSDDKPARILEQLNTLRASVERSVSREQLRAQIPPGGARNALDCALWDLEAKISGQPVWKLAGFAAEPQPLVTTFTCHAEPPDVVVAKALGFKDARAIKLKLTGSEEDFDRVKGVRAALPQAWLGVDANQGFTLPFLQRILPTLEEAQVALIEQPFAVGQERLLAKVRSPIPLAADESLQDLPDIERLRGIYDVVNIKLDKCGGLTEALLIAAAARAAGMSIMVGNMCGTSLAMAPAFLVGQHATIVDLDGPALLSRDRTEHVQYRDGRIECHDAVWGGAADTNGAEKKEVGPAMGLHR